MENLKLIGTPSTLTCPDCGGALFELNDKRALRYRCHTGHAFSLRSLACAQEEAADYAIWAALRALQEKEAALRRLAEVSSPAGSARAALALREADELADTSKRLRAIATNAPGGYSSFDMAD